MRRRELLVCAGRHLPAHCIWKQFDFDVGAGGHARHRKVARSRVYSLRSLLTSAESSVQHRWQKSVEFRHHFPLTPFDLQILAVQ